MAKEKTEKTYKNVLKKARKQPKKTSQKQVEKSGSVSKSKRAGVKKTEKSFLREKKILEIKNNLLSQRERLLKEAEETLTTLPGVMNFPDMGDQATAETERNFILRLRDRERMLLKKIDETIERIDEGTYGICEGCGAEINIKRLEARPVTTLCIDCKTRQEEEERMGEAV